MWKSPVEVQGIRRLHSALAGDSGIGTGFGKEDNSLGGTSGFWKRGAAIEPFPEGPWSHNRSENDQLHLAKSEYHHETLRVPSWSLRFSEPKR